MRLEGFEYIDKKIIEINQLPIDRTPTSNPAIYVGIFNDVRNTLRVSRFPREER